MHLVNETAPRLSGWGSEAHFQLFAERLLQLQGAELARLQGVLRRAADCLPDMPAVCCQAVQLTVEGGEFARWMAPVEDEP